MLRAVPRSPRSLVASAGFLPTTPADLRARGWDRLDVLIVTGDAYVDHPAFGPVLVARFLEARGLRVGLVAQPRWDTVDDVARLGAPRLFVGVSAGNLDSMLNKLTAQKKPRSEDRYSPDGQVGLRPNRASVVYANLCRRAFPGVPVVLGGIEASLRRIAHYDYWADAVRRSVLLDAKADLLVFGMGELTAWRVAERLAAGARVQDLRDLPGTAYPLRGSGALEAALARSVTRVGEAGVVVLPSFAEVSTDPAAFSRMTRAFQLETNPLNARPLLQRFDSEAVYYNPPAGPLTTAEMDALYALPFQRRPHPSYGAAKIPAFETVRESVVATRGCFGGCSFCSITEHEGRIVQSRSAESVVAEVRRLSRMDDFSGTITDVGGPTANMYQLRCTDAEAERQCRRLSCVHPTICKNLGTDQGAYVDLLRRVRETKGVRRVFVASGVRTDLALRSPALIEALARHHVGGQLSVAPEHHDPEVLRRMKKPPVEIYDRFVERFCDASERAGKRQFLVPYFIAGHPGSGFADTVSLALWLKRRDVRPRQVQELIPTPMSLATSMYYTGLDPMTGEAVEVVRDLREKRMLKALLQWWDEAQWPLAREALARAGRTDLIGRARRCLIPPADRAVGSPVRAGDARARAPRRPSARALTSRPGSA
ncbi:MAG: YgiQ family radical SAM protein [Polyangiaceae bacterium]|nr:YgiQ family radical SAM protein [Polyangiaceae bacterium]